MDPEIRKAALRAAAKTAIALTLTGGTLGASAMLATGCSESHSRQPMSMYVGDAAPGDDASTGGQDSGPPATSSDSGAGEDAALDCDAHLASLELTGEDRWSSRFASEEARQSALTGDCCMELHVRAEQGEPSGATEELDMACCAVIVFDQHRVGTSVLGCTPWGPPCPPEMPTLA